MYSIVMLTAMSAGADVTPPPAAAPAAAVPVVASGCCGSVPMGCYGSSCHGSSCHGGGFLNRVHHRHSCTGYSCSGYNCFGSCHGSCTGCAGAISFGSNWGPPVGMPPYTLHGYNSGSGHLYGPGYPAVMGDRYTDPNAVYGSTYSPNRPPVMTIPVAPIPKASSDSPMGANLKFQLPADAKLFVDGKPAPGAGAERRFYTPPLAAGQKYFYEVKAELVVDGKLVVEDKHVIVEAGANLTETFPKLTAALNGGSTVAGK